MAACAFVSLSVALLGGGPLGLAFVVPPAGHADVGGLAGRRS